MDLNSNALLTEELESGICEMLNAYLVHVEDVLCDIELRDGDLLMR